MMFWRRKREQDLDRELRDHLQLEAHELRDPYAARRMAPRLAGLAGRSHDRPEVRIAAQGWRCHGSVQKNRTAPPRQAPLCRGFLERWG